MRAMSNPRFTRLVALGVAVALAACARETPPPPREFESAKAFEYLRTQVGFGTRHPGYGAPRAGWRNGSTACSARGPIR